MLNKLAILAVRAYRKTISPYMLHSCRFVPSCSEYAEGALQKYGAFQGLGLTVKRLLRCQPFGAHGFDPVS